MVAMIGHNGGPSIAKGAGFRTVAWRKARATLLPSLPLEIVRMRVKRAERLGLPYKTYATIRAVSGRDIVAFLFSSNALDMRSAPQIPAPEVARLRELQGAVQRLGALHYPLRPIDVAPNDALDHVAQAPSWTAQWSETRATLRAIALDAGGPSDGSVVVAATALERPWADCAGFAAAVGANAVFSQRASTVI